MHWKGENTQRLEWGGEHVQKLNWKGNMFRDSTVSEDVFESKNRKGGIIDDWKGEYIQYNEETGREKMLKG